MRLFLILALALALGASTARAQTAGHDLASYLNKDYKIVGFTHSESGPYDIFILQNGHSAVRCVVGGYTPGCTVLN